jgi:hypothetical protein
MLKRICQSITDVILRAVARVPPENRVSDTWLYETARRGSRVEYHGPTWKWPVEREKL